jgi:hypothetical protein
LSYLENPKLRNKKTSAAESIDGDIQ